MRGRKRCVSRVLGAGQSPREITSGAMFYMDQGGCLEGCVAVTVPRQEDAVELQ